MSLLRVRINDFDLSAITNEVNSWQSHGKYASYDISHRDDGLAIMTLENVYAETPRYVVYEIHKLGRKGLLGTKSFWVIQLYSASDANESFERRGCAAGKMLVRALTEAQKDVKFGFLSTVDFQLAVDAMTE